MLAQDPALDLPPFTARQDSRDSRYLPLGTAKDPPWDTPGDITPPPRRTRRALRARRIVPASASRRAGRARPRAAVPPRHGARIAERRPARAGVYERRHGAGDRAAASAARRRGRGFWLGVGRRAGRLRVAGLIRRGARSPPPSRSAPSQAVSWPRTARSGCSTGTTAPWPGSTRGPTRWRRPSSCPASRATSCSARARCGSPAGVTGRCGGSTPAPAAPRARSAPCWRPRAGWLRRTARSGWRPTARAQCPGSTPGPER